MSLSSLNSERDASGESRVYALCCEGAMQGRGARPLVMKLARELGLHGMVCNRGSGLLIEAVSSPQSWAVFTRQLAEHLLVTGNGLAQTDQMSGHALSPLAREAIAQKQFVIGPSMVAERTLHVPLDRGICASCVSEIMDPASRRYQHLLNGCVHCGPRYTAIRELPFDRASSALAPFDLCDGCQAAFADPDDPRCHEQLISCRQCGPRYAMENSRGECLAGEPDQLLAESARRIAAGQILAIQGVGGFHLCCDATRADAVARLRKLKRRPLKPFAVMGHLNQLRSLVDLPSSLQQRLASPERPVLVLPRLGNDLKGVAPGLERLGVMLPYTAFQYLLLAQLAHPVVMTSANRSGEPMQCRPGQMRQWLPEIDALVFHDRVIERSIEDSVIQALPAGLPIGEQTVRLGRGLTPLVMDEVPTPDFPDSQGNVLAMGGELKSSVAVAVAKAESVVMSPYQGDLYHADVLHAYRNFVPDFLDLLSVRPDCVVVDRHPDYQATRYGQELADRWRVPLFRAQHHHAHAVSVMAEHRLPMDQRIPAIVMDGLGWGDDDTLWGGELLYCDGSDYCRLAALKPFTLLGGNLAAQQPWRNGLALMGALPASHLVAFQKALASQYPQKQALINAAAMLVQKSKAGLLTSSAGRLFDGVAALLGFPVFGISDEAEAAVWLQQQAEMAFETVTLEAITERLEGCVPAAIEKDTEERPYRLIDPAGFLEYLMNQRTHQSCQELALLFHGWLALSFQQALCGLREAAVIPTDTSKVVLGGGVMQNGLLLTLLVECLQQQGFEVLLPGRIPANDNGLALGQAMIGQQRLAADQRSHHSCV